MKGPRKLTAGRDRERGFTFGFVAVCLIVLVGAGALAIDLAELYVARNEAQRAADGAALAGAKVYAESGCLDSRTCSTMDATAQQRATDVGNLDLVAGQAPTVTATPNETNPVNPQITVQVTSSSINTIFALAFGFTSNTVTASATAEAYLPSGDTAGLTFCASCTRPWFMANCDQNTADQGNPNTLGCPLNPVSGTALNYLIDPANNYAVVSPGCDTGGTGSIGEPIVMTLYPAAAPYYYGSVDSGGGEPGYVTAIDTCSIGTQVCGGSFSSLATIPGDTINAVDTLLHLPMNTVGANAGQDSISPNSCPPKILVGANNPLVLQGVVGQNAPINISDSIVTIPVFSGVYNGGPLPAPPQTGIQIVGFAQLFITQVDANGNVYANLLNIAGCSGSNAGACGAAGSVSGNGAGMVPVRLVSGN